MTATPVEPRGVQDLIDRIREEGVRQARQEAERIVTEAERKAAGMLASAHEEVQQLKEQIQREIEAERAAAIEALKLSARDTVLQLESQVFSAFERFVQKLVTDATCDKEFIRSLVLVLAGHTVDEFVSDKDIQILISDSRWAQAMRETSGRMEEIPGEEGFPAYLDSSIKSVYERAGVIRGAHGETGSLTMIGTVSPAGGNFEEPVTQATLATVKTFLGLSAERAYKRFYPAIDPLISWSRYLGQLAEWYRHHLDPHWVEDVEGMQELLQRGDAIYQIMQVTGEEGITLEDFVTWQKAVLVDMVYLQQDAFDEVDAHMPRERQLTSFQLLKHLIECEYDFKGKDEAREFFIKLTGLYKNWNYSSQESPEFERYHKEIEGLAASHSLAEEGIEKSS